MRRKQSAKLVYGQGTYLLDDIMINSLTDKMIGK